MATPTGFVEVSGYSKSDLDGQYQEGYEQGVEDSLGTTDATQAQVLSGYSFSSAVQGMQNKPGTMANNGAWGANNVLPGQYATVPQGYHAGGRVYAKANSGAYTCPTPSSGTTAANTFDMGELNTYRSVNASACYNKGYGDGRAQGQADITSNWPTRFSGVQVNSFSGKLTKSNYTTIHTFSNEKCLFVVSVASSDKEHSAVPYIMCDSTAGSIIFFNRQGRNADGVRCETDCMVVAVNGGSGEIKIGNPDYAVNATAIVTRLAM